MKFRCVALRIHYNRDEFHSRAVTFKTNHKRNLLKTAFICVLTVGCGLLLWQSPLGDPWVNASYDYLFRFGSHPVTNNVEVILMDNEAFDQFGQERGQPWDREIHARLLNKLADDGCELVVFDAFFRVPRDPIKDEALTSAMQRHKRIVLMADKAEVNHPGAEGVRPIPPTEPFLSATSNNWGVAGLYRELDSVVRRHWPIPSPGPFSSLPWAVASAAGARLQTEPRERWLRYYSEQGAWTSLSYAYALAQPTNYYRGKIVFIGTKPKTPVPNDDIDEFETPYTRWTGEATGGVQIMVAASLNLLNEDWMERPSWWAECLAIIVSGVLLAATVLLRPRIAIAFAVGFALLVALGAVTWSHFSNYWFPWFVISGAQVPLALACAALMPRFLEPVPEVVPSEPIPETPDYEILQPAFGQGAYGRVWLARNAIGEWQALKAVYLAKFGDDPDPYDREFNGVSKYKPISDKHPGLLRVDFVSQKKEAGYFFYVMELGDPLDADWERKPSTYKPRDLSSERKRAPGQKLPVRQCIHIGFVLADALDFLHQRGLTHRDIKPQNVLFVDGQPKLADLGLIAEIRPPEQKHTYVGTPGYMPPPPESPGTPQADIYALGMMLYVLSTGSNPKFFPEISTTLAESTSVADFFVLNAIILKACQPDITQRYASAAEMRLALQEAQIGLAGNAKTETPVANSTAK